MAKHYDLPIWSYRNVSRFEERKELKEQISFQRQPVVFWQHPRWPLHLFHADLIGAAMLETLQTCRAQDNQRTLFGNKEYHRNYTVPLPLRHQSMMLCASGEANIMGRHSAAIAATSAAIAVMASNSTGSTTTSLLMSGATALVSNSTLWQLNRTDHGQPGWIGRLPFPIVSSIGLTAIRSAAGHPQSQQITNNATNNHAHTGLLSDTSSQ